MNKLRSDSAFCQLTPEQVDMLEGWLFEERLGYPRVVERLKAEFGLETSLTAVRRFYKRMDVERSAQSLMDAVELSGLTVEALKGGNLKPAMLLFANKCAFELMRQSEPPIRKVTALLRAITSAEAHTMRQTIYEREQAELREAERVRKARESWRMTPRDLAEEKEELRQEREARRKAKQEAAEKAAKESENLRVAEVTFSSKTESGKDHADFGPCAKLEQQIGERSVPPHPGPLPWGEGETTSAVVANGASGNGSVAELGGRGGGVETRSPDDGPATKDAEVAWQPSVVEEQDADEINMAEAAENRLTPLNAA